MKVGDLIKLNCDVKEFSIYTYLSPTHGYSFKYVQFRYSKFDKSMYRNEPEIKNVPIILFNYEEELLQIISENGKRTGFTKSFKIDLGKAIEEKEIIVNDTSANEMKSLEHYETFINELIERNSEFDMGLITDLGKMNLIVDHFFNRFISQVSDKEIQYFNSDILKLYSREKFRKSLDSDEDYFSSFWNWFFTFRNYLEVELNNKKITIFRNAQQPRILSWLENFVLDAISKGIDKKTRINQYISGFHISRNRYTNNSRVVYISTCVENESKLNENGEWEFKTGKTYLKVRHYQNNWEEFDCDLDHDLWQDQRFLKMIENVLDCEVS